MRVPFSIIVPIVISVLLGADAAAGDGPPMTRAEFARAMAKVKEGMDQVMVLGLLGEPDDVRTQHDPGGIGGPETKEIWCYGTDGHLTFPTLGRVTINVDGRVRSFSGAGGTPPDPELFEEGELRRLLGIIDTVPRWEGPNCDPLRVIKITNALQAVGKEKALAATEEYLRVASGYAWHSSGLVFVLRALFDVPPGAVEEAMRRPEPPEHWTVESRREYYHLILAIPLIRHLRAPEKYRQQSPRYPIVIQDDIPLHLHPFYIGTGSDDMGDYIQFFREHGTFHDRPLRPTDEPLAVLDRLMTSPEWVFVDDHAAGAARAREYVMNQLLRLVDTVYHVPPNRCGWRLGSEDVEARWAEIRAEFDQLDVRWDPERNMYVFADATYLEPPRSGQYPREIWKAEQLPRKTFVAVERFDGKQVTITLRFTTLDPLRGSPSVHIRVVGVGSPQKHLGELDIAWAFEECGSGSVFGMFPVPEGKRIQLVLEIDGQIVEESPVFQP